MRAALDAWAGEGRGEGRAGESRGEQGGGKGGCDSTPKKKEPKKEWCRGLLVDGLFFPWFRKDRLHFSSLRRRKERGGGEGGSIHRNSGSAARLDELGSVFITGEAGSCKNGRRGRGEICIISREKTACSMLPY